MKIWPQDGYSKYSSELILFDERTSRGHKNSSQGYFVQRSPNMVNIAFDKFQKKYWLIKNMLSYCCRKVFVRDLMCLVTQNKICNHIMTSNFIFWKLKFLFWKKCFLTELHFIGFFKVKMWWKSHWQTFRNVFQHYRCSVNDSPPPLRRGGCNLQ